MLSILISYTFIVIFLLVECFLFCLFIKCMQDEKKGYHLMDKSKIHYYEDEINDEFSGIKKEPRFIKDDFKYINENFFWKIAAAFCYRVVMTPIAFLYCKLIMKMKIVNAKALRPFKKHGYFLYGNHTHVPADAYIPNVLNFPKTNYVIVNSENLSAKGTANLMMMIGAFPLPSTIHGTRNFLSSMEKRLVNGNAMVVYPEAHIWPYFTGIRNYKSVSFKYPVRFNDPSFCFTTTYQKRKHSKKPRMTVYVDGPFYGDENLSDKEKQENLRDKIYNTMCLRAKNSNYEYVKYVKKGNQ